jgi:hypothetical protein
MRVSLVLLLVAWAAAAAAREDALRFSVSVRQPEQLAAFYSARGFPPEAVAAITRVCFVTVGIVNESQDVVWVVPSEWRFESDDGRKLTRVTREDWERLWQTIDLAPGRRATFGWTLLPEARDLQPSEPVGGNVTLLPPSASTARPFRLTARLRTGAHGEGEPIVIERQGLVCPAGEAQ